MPLAALLLRPLTAGRGFAARGAVVRRSTNGERITGGGMFAKPSLTTPGRPGTDWSELEGPGADSSSLGFLETEQRSAKRKHEGKRQWWLQDSDHHENAFALKELPNLFVCTPVRPSVYPLIRISAAALIKFSVIRVRRLFEGSAY